MAPDEVKGTSIIMPILPKGILHTLSIKGFKRGVLYGAGNNDSLTLIHTGPAAPFVGDTVLSLKDTPAKNVILFGSCGLVPGMSGLSIGSLVTPTDYFSNESFSDLLATGHITKGSVKPDPKLMAAISSAADIEITKVSCATLPSLLLEEGMVELFRKERIAALEMEASAFFAAAEKTGLSAAALFYVSDIVHEKPFYSLDAQSKHTIKTAVDTGARLLWKIAQTL